ncbi:unnamed protein product [Lota lota]
MELIELFCIICFTALCSAIDESEIPVPSVALLTPWHAVFTSEKVELSCGIQDSPGNWTYTWYRGGQEVAVQGPDVSVRSNVSSLVISSAKPEHAGEYTCTGKLKGRPVGSKPSNKLSLEVNEIPVPSVALLTPWPAVFTSEKVELSCGMQDSPDRWTYTWYRGGQEVAVQGPDVSVRSNVSYLVISSAKPEHAGEYTCTGQFKGRPVGSKPSNKLSLEVNVNSPILGDRPRLTLQKDSGFEQLYAGESVSLSCQVNVSSRWEYRWYKDGDVSVRSNVSYLVISSAKPEHAGEYTCTGQFKGRPVGSKPSNKLSLEVNEIPVPSVALLTPWPAVFTSEKVELSCGMQGSPNNWTYTWYRGGQEVAVQGPDVSVRSNGSSLVISSAKPEHAGEYTCTGQLKGRPVGSKPSNKRSLEVTEIPVPSVALLTPWPAVFTSEKVELSCGMQGSPNNWTYTWYRGGQEVAVQGPDVSVRSNGSSLVISSAKPEHAGEYTCTGQLKGRPVGSKPSNKRSLEVTDIPKPTIKLNTPWPQVFCTERVELDCRVEGSSEWRYIWYRDRTEIQAGNGDLATDGTTLSFPAALTIHAGKYTCKGQHKSRTLTTYKISDELTLKVNEIPVPSVALQTPWPDVFTSEKVELSCGMQDSPDHWTYAWYRGGQEVAVQGPDVSVRSNVSYLVISSAKPEHSGEYTCTGQLKGRPVVSKPSNKLSLEVNDIPKPTIKLNTPWPQVFCTERVELDCRVEGSSEWRYIWYRDRTEIQAGNGDLATDGTTLSFPAALTIHAGKYTCKGQHKSRTLTTYKISDELTLKVNEIPVPSVALQTPWPDVFPSEKVELSCGMQDSPDHWTYTWYRGGQDVAVQGPDVSVRPGGSYLMISSAKPEHAGQYTCTGKHKQRLVMSKPSNKLSLVVYDKKPTPELTQDPGYRKVYAEESLTFSCKVNASSGWEFHWLRGQAKLPKQGATHAIPSAAPVDAGAHRCRATRGQNPPFVTEDSNTLSIDVEARPWATVTLLTGWSEVFSADRLDLKCEVHGSTDQWNYTWFGGSEDFPLSYNAKHPVMSKDLNHSQYICKGVRSSRPLYSKASEPFRTTNLLLKRRVLLSISGCLFFGIIAVFIGCIVMRLTRKPVTNEDKPKEPNLFLTMAELEARDVAPCPLAEYVTDEVLPALTKDGEDKETVCNESTPFASSFPEGEAETSESNGGMKSFQY